jgi:hypothetical protein
MTKIAILTKEQGREIYKQELEPGAKFYPVLDKDMNIVLTEQEIAKADTKVFPWIADLELKEKSEVDESHLDEKAYYEKEKAAAEARIAELDTKLAQLDTQIDTKPENTEIKK